MRKKLPNNKIRNDMKYNYMIYDICTKNKGNINRLFFYINIYNIKEYQSFYYSIRSFIRCNISDNYFSFCLIIFIDFLCLAFNSTIYLVSFSIFSTTFYKS